MSSPKEQKKLWKNIDWKSGDEKRAFFNKYFKDSQLVSDHVAKNMLSFKQGLIEMIKDGKIKEKDKERDITMQDILKELESSIER